MDHAFKVLVTAALAIVAVAIITVLLYFGFFIFSVVRLENQTPQCQVLIDALFHGACIRYEKLEKAHLGYTGHQYLLVFNNQYVWSAGERIEHHYEGFVLHERSCLC